MPRPRVWLGAAALVAIGVAVGLVVGLSARDRTTSSTVTQGVSDLIPPRADLVDVTSLRGTVPPQVAVVSRRRSAPFGAGFRLAVWERRQEVWRRIYSRTLPDHEWQIEGVRLSSVDMTSDGRNDLLVYDDHGGSAGGFTFRAFRSLPGRMEQIDVVDGSTDRNAVFTRAPDLVTYKGVGKDPASGSDIHCCPRYWLRAVKHWNGRRLVIVSRTRARSVPVWSMPEVR